MQIGSYEGRNLRRRSTVDDTVEGKNDIGRSKRQAADDFDRKRIADSSQNPNGSGQNDDRIRYVLRLQADNPEQSGSICERSPREPRLVGVYGASGIKKDTHLLITTFL